MLPKRKRLELPLSCPEKLAFSIQALQNRQSSGAWRRRGANHPTPRPDAAVVRSGSPVVVVWPAVFFSQLTSGSGGLRSLSPFNTGHWVGTPNRPSAFYATVLRQSWKLLSGLVEVLWYQLMQLGCEIHVILRIGTEGGLVGSLICQISLVRDIIWLLTIMSESHGNCL